MTETETAIADLLAMDDEQFADVVNAETRDRVSPYVKEALRADAELTRRWYNTVRLMHKSIEGQFAAKTADNSAKIMKLDMGGASRHTVMEESASFEQWRAGALRVKNGLEIRLIEVKAIMEQRGDSYVTERTAAERNAAYARVGVLEDAIRRHRAWLLEDATEGEDASDADKALWAYLPPEDYLPWDHPHHFADLSPLPLETP